MAQPFSSLIIECDMLQKPLAIDFLIIINFLFFNQLKMHKIYMSFHGGNIICFIVLDETLAKNITLV
jgi:hypothetical protein